MRLPGEISREEYDSYPAVRWSALSHMRKSPIHYKHALETASKSTKARRTGSALHTLVFEPETYDERFTVYRKSKTKGEGARKDWEAFQEDAKARGLEILDAEEEARALGCQAAIARLDTNRYIAPSRGRAEVPITWTDARTGLKCKARIDWLTVDMLAMDLKSTRSAEQRNFGRQAWHLGYFHQQSFYTEGLATIMGCKPEEVPFLFLAVESDPPHDGAMYDPCQETRYAATEEVHALMDKLAECERTGKWPGRYDGIQELKAPAYVLMSEDEDWQTTVTQEAA